ncbi:MAG: hypothetical protein KatS3mg051_0532 [Anaerolineae bacterium]|nr:MAG: hypothetical protein KatS3mg051_0532 [Anaerolineae bacterium]
MIFLLVGDAGVSTGVYLPEPTLTYTPTSTPTPTPLPDPVAANWTEMQAGQWYYQGPQEVNARINYTAIALEDFVTRTNLTPPPDDSAYPLVDVLGQMRDNLQKQATDAGLTIGEDAFNGPVIEVIANVPVTLLHLRLQAQDRPSGEPFPGLDLVEAFVERQDGRVTFVQYILQGEPDLLVYRDFRAWLVEHMDRLTGAAEGETSTATPAAETPEEGASPAEATVTPEAPAASATPVAESTPVTTPEPESGD